MEDVHRYCISCTIQPIRGNIQRRESLVYIGNTTTFFDTTGVRRQHLIWGLIEVKAFKMKLMSSRRWRGNGNPDRRVIGDRKHSTELNVQYIPLSPWEVRRSDMARVRGTKELGWLLAGSIEAEIWAIKAHGSFLTKKPWGGKRRDVESIVY